MATIPGLGGLNTDAHSIDDKGNVQVDFVWGNFPLQPNDDRDTKTIFSAKTRTVTAASGNGTTVTYTVNHGYAIGELVTITGLSTAAFNLNGVAVASIIYTNNIATGFTVTNSATGTAVTSAFGSVSPNATNLDFTLNNHVRVETGYNGYPLYTPQTDGTYSTDANGRPYLPFAIVPVLVGDLTAVALDNISDAGLVSAQAANATNTAILISQIVVGTTTTATVSSVGAAAAYPVGSLVAIAAGTSIPAALVGTWSVIGTSGANNIIITGTGWTVADTGVISGNTSLTGKSGTIKTQSVAPTLVAAVTAASGNGTTVTYTAANNFVVGQTVAITGLSTAAFNLGTLAAPVTIASIVYTSGIATGFTVTNAATGTAVTASTTGSATNDASVALNTTVTITPWA